MNRKLKKLTLIVICSIFLGVALVYAYYEDSISVKNHIAMGDVNIGITEYEMKNGREVLYKNDKTVFPGDYISKIPRVTNYANDCWIRVKIDFTDNLENVEGISSDHISGMSELWVKRGEYYYYTKILGKNSHVDVFRMITIPEIWNIEHASQELSLKIQAEAIQSANFQPDFSAMSPWGNQEIELCVHEEKGAISCVKDEMKLSVEFSGKAHKLLAVPGNFFHNIKRAMPGDVYKDTIMLSNTTEKEAELFFSTEVRNQTEEQRELLEKINLIISMNEKVLYKGSLLSEELEEDISLGIYKPESSGNMDFEISIPDELKNAYALREADVNWIFSVKEEENQAGNNMNEDNNKSAVKTGDFSPIELMLVCGIISAIVAGVIVVKKKKEADSL